MKKDAYYFPHFCNARNDSKIIKLRRVLGIEGYGIYFMLLEILREQTDFKYPIAGIEDLSYEWHTSKEKIATVINDFELFTIVDNEFFSAKLVFYLQPYIEKSERARIAARKRWDAINTNADAKALQMHNIEDANVLPEQCISECKESKVNESKEKKVNTDFNLFWNSYHEISGKPKTDLRAAEKYWNKLNESEKKKAFDNIKPYCESISDKKYIKKARTYLADKNFNDEFKSEIIYSGNLEDYIFPGFTRTSFSESQLIEGIKKGLYKKK